MKPTLLVLAAGMGSRYGGLKQLEGVGPHGEMILDYSLYDAIRAGFGKVVFVVRRDIEALFREKIGKRFEGKIGIEYAFQSLADLPSPFLVPPGRQKPWGTGHAILSAREHICEPFAIINADDFYGAESFHILSGFLSSAKEEHFAMVGYRLDQTLSEFGAVSRGICFCDEDGFLEEVVECGNIEWREKEKRIVGINPSGNEVAFQGDEKTSLNFWGVSPMIFPLLEEKFRTFLSERGREEKAEFYIPSAIDRLIAEKRIRVHVLPTPERWFGVTYPADKPKVEEGIRGFIAEGKYPERLWGEES